VVPGVDGVVPGVNGVVPGVNGVVPGVDADHGVYPWLEPHGDEAGAKVLGPQQHLLVGQPLNRSAGFNFNFVESHESPSFSVNTVELQNWSTGYDVDQYVYFVCNAIMNLFSKAYIIEKKFLPNICWLCAKNIYYHVCLFELSIFSCYSFWQIILAHFTRKCVNSAGTVHKICLYIL
jgi:hypothetical protein